MRFLAKALICTAPLHSVVPSIALGKTGTTESSYLDDAALANRMTLMESAGSHGSLGLKFGIGARMLPADNSGKTQGNEESREASPELSVIKGTSLPVDLGIIFGTNAVSESMQGGLIAQWTVFEDFALPAVSLRAGGFSTLGSSTTRLRTASAGGYIGYGFLRYFSLYAGTDFLWQFAQISGEDRVQFGLKSGDTRTSDRKDWTTTAATGGIRVMIYPPLCYFVTETSYSGQARNFSAKIALGM